MDVNKDSLSYESHDKSIFHNVKRGRFDSCAMNYDKRMWSH